MGMVYIFGIIVFIPAVICAGIILPRFMKNLDRPVPTLMKQSKQFTEEEMPRFATSILVPLSPAIIITCGTIFKAFCRRRIYCSLPLLTSFRSAEISMLIAD